MNSNDTINVKWLHNGTYRRFQIPLATNVDIYAVLLQKVKAVVYYRSAGVSSKAMNSNDTINVKWLHNGTYRRFQIPLATNVDIYAVLLQKVKAVVPDFADDFAWEDEDGDAIIFSTYAEMKEAVTLPVNQPLFRIHTVEKSTGKKQATETNMNKENEKEKHSGVTCDMCDKGIAGIRYKCAVCDDFDLCEKCERSGQHAEHPMIRYATPRTPRVEDFLRARRHPHRRFHHAGFRGPLTADGLFARCPAAATAAATATEVAAAANEAAFAAAQRAATAFAENMTRANTTAQSQDPSQHLRESFATGMEYLREVGAQVQQALANFGIEVDMDVEHGGRTERVPRAGSDNQQKQPNEDETAKENKENEENRENKEPTEKRKNDETTGANTEEANVDEDVSVPMKKMHISEPNVEQAEEVQHEGGENGANGNDPEPNTEVLVDIHGDGTDTWTMMDNSDLDHNKSGSQEPTAPVYPTLADAGINCMAGTPFIVPAPGPHNPHCLFIHPDKRVAECVKQLESMGFDNCNGWLTKLASTHGGDTTRVVESLADDPVYAKRLQSCM
ncbi:Sequestosome-1 [Toxocara canis]|uniref:Sequestosome-1 n=2 Tax=Toxocara canis TaxID=6265 RepID=A0A0B2UTJ9_TOXCA|nr:Sequestosome-1 [Toxocara canis]